MSNKILEVHWITYQNKDTSAEENGKQGWATVNSEDYQDWIFYGDEPYPVTANLPYANGFEHAMHEAKLTNNRAGFNGEVKIIGKEESIRARYKAYQWMN